MATKLERPLKREIVIDGPQSVVFQEAANRLHTGKALMALTMGGYS